MLGKTNRLTKRKEFGYIYKKGTTTYSNFIGLYSVPTNKKVARIGFSISKKIGKAHTRNLVKRRLSEIIHDILPNINPNFNYIFVAREGIDKLPFEDLKGQVLYLLNKADKYQKQDNE